MLFCFEGMVQAKIISTMQHSNIMIPYGNHTMFEVQGWGKHQVININDPNDDDENLLGGAERVSL